MPPGLADIKLDESRQWLVCCFLDRFKTARPSEKSYRIKYCVVANHC